jgi:hypothetical protein
MAESKSKCNAHFIACLHCDKQIRQERMGTHYLSKHRNQLFTDPNFERALDYSILNSLPTIFIDNRRVCLCCGSGFSKPNKTGYYNNDDKLIREQDQSISRHFKNNSEHASANQKIYAELKKQLVEYKATTKSLPVTQTTETSKLKKELDDTKRKLELMTQKFENMKERVKEAEMDYNVNSEAYNFIMDMYNKHFKVDNQTKKDIRDGLLVRLQEIYKYKMKDDPDGDKELEETEEGCELIKLKDGDYLEYFDQDAYRCYKKEQEIQQEVESEDNAYKYGYYKHEDQHSDGVYDGEVDIEPWMN